jgi:DnaJ-class molecular chaperone
MKIAPLVQLGAWHALMRHRDHWNDCRRCRGDGFVFGWHESHGERRVARVVCPDCHGVG